MNVFWNITLAHTFPLVCMAAPLAEPFKVMSDGKPIDTGPNTSYTGALIGDFTGDGIDDLAVTSISGAFWIYQNTNSKKTGDPIYIRALNIKKEKIPPSIAHYTTKIIRSAQVIHS